jgi:hypothetical protein
MCYKKSEPMLQYATEKAFNGPAQNELDLECFYAMLYAGFSAQTAE